MPQKLNQKIVDALKPGAPRVIRDESTPGFLVRISKSTVCYAVQRELRTGPRRKGTLVKTVRHTIARTEEMKLDAARARGRELLEAIKNGIDPNAPLAPAPVIWTVERAFAAYAAAHSGVEVGAVLRQIRGESTAAEPPVELERTSQDMLDRLRRYLADWAPLELASITRDMVLARHTKIMTDVRDRARSVRATGARAANQTVKDLAAVWNFASDATPLPMNPARRLKTVLAEETKAHHELSIGALPKWWAAVEALPNPLRRVMHKFALLSGLRPSNVTGLRREWLRLDDPGGPRINFPASAMKAGKPFVLPLSGAMVALLREALTAGDVMHPGSPWVFPTRSADGREVIATAVCREKITKPKNGEPKNAALKNATGHALRHTWKNCARLARLPEATIEVLLSHSVGAMGDRYGSLVEQFERYLADQETVSAFILSKIHP